MRKNATRSKPIAHQRHRPIRQRALPDAVHDDHAFQQGQQRRRPMCRLAARRAMCRATRRSRKGKPPMPLFSILPVLAGLATAAFVLTYARRTTPLGPQAWIAAASLCAGFAGWSLYAIATGGPFGFWVEHTRNAWGVQIWFDLLLAAGCALVFMVPEARRLGMRPLPWVAFVLCSGAIGLLAMLTRILYLRHRALT